MDYKPNSNRFKEEQKREAAKPTEERKKVEKVIDGVVTTKKKSEVGKVAQFFISDDFHKAKSWAVNDVLLPMVKRAILGTLDILLKGGDAGYTSGRDRDSKISYVPYRRMSEGSRYERDREEREVQSRLDYEEIVFRSRNDAERTLDEMRAIRAEYQNVTVADLYDLVGKDHPYTFTKYGWSSLMDADVVPYRDGYIIRLPKARPVTW